MNKKEVVQKSKKTFHKFVITKVIDTGELYVATFCSRSGQYIPEFPLSMTYDGEFGRYDIMDTDKWVAFKRGTVLYEDYGRIEARKRLLARGYDV